METPREWTKRYNRDEMTPEAGPHDRAAAAEASEFPTEPFPCPACGQMLAPSCRVCVACRETINPAEIALSPGVGWRAAPAPALECRPKSVRYPWPIFFAVLGISCVVAMILTGFMEQQKAQLAMWGLQMLAGIWVYIDALRRGIPRPLRWAAGTILLPVFIIFPWYLARRTKPQSSVPFVEAEVGRLTRFLAFALVVFFLLSAIIYVVEGPKPDHKDGYLIFRPK